MIRARFSGVLVLAGLFVALAAGAARAQFTANWLNPVSGNWNDPLQWSTNPDFPNNNGPNTYNVFLAATGAAHTVTLNQAITISNFTMSSADVTLDLTNNALSVLGDYTQSAGVLFGLGGTGSVHVGGVAHLQGATFIGVSDFRAKGGLDFSGTGDNEICDTNIFHDGGGGGWDDTGDIIMDQGSLLEIGAAATFDIRNGQSLLWTNVGAQPTVSVLGTMTKSAGATTTLTGVAFDNTGTLDVSAGVFSTDGVVLPTGTLSTGTWKVRGGANLDLVGTTILTNETTVELSDAGSAFAALDSLQTNGVAGVLTFDTGRDFTSTGAFVNDGALTARGTGTNFASAGTLLNTGTLNVETGATATSGGDLTQNGTVVIDTGSVLDVAPGSALTNLAAGTLSGGTYDIKGTLLVDNGDVATVGADVTIDGASANIINRTTGLSGIDSVVTGVNASGKLTVRNRPTFTTGGDFLVAGAGQLGVGAGTTFVVDGALLNIAAGTFTDGNFDINGTLQANDAAISVIAGTLNLDDPAGAIVDQFGGDALAGLDELTGAGNLRISNGRDLTTAGALSNAGGLTVGPRTPTNDTILTVGTVFSQSAGLTNVDGGLLMVTGDLNQTGGVIHLGGGTSRVEVGGAMNLTGGMLTGNGEINGAVFNGGSIGPGGSAGLLTIVGNMLQQPGGAVQIELGGIIPVALHDVIDIQGDLAFSGLSAGTFILTLIDGFTPSLGQTFDVILYDNAVGDFQQYVYPALGGGLSFTHQMTPNALRISVVPAPGVGAVLFAAGLFGFRRRR